MAQNFSKNLSFIGRNIKKIRQVKKISQAEFAHLFHLSRPSIGAYEEGRSEPKIETLIQNKIPVLGHLGFLPQSIKEEKYYKKKGKTE